MKFFLVGFSISSFHLTQHKETLSPHGLPSTHRNPGPTLQILVLWAILPFPVHCIEITRSLWSFGITFSSIILRPLMFISLFSFLFYIISFYFCSVLFLFLFVCWENLERIFMDLVLLERCNEYFYFWNLTVCKRKLFVFNRAF